MTSDVRIISSSDGAESQNSEPNSLREVLLFCTVLLVEVYSLAVSFGGPFFEVGYFLLVVVSQTFAGAYIWAQLRRTDETLPLPELLAMGFAIGSASAAISQLIVRDLLGIRLFISPLIPIIGVTIWLVTKRNARLPVQVTHATTNTLLWLLFPAPLALSFFVWELYAIFVIPLLIFTIIIARTKNTSEYLILVSLATLSAIFGVLIRMVHPISVALRLVGGDEIMDEGFAIGFSNWGINENIGRAGDSFAYYKLSHSWLAPLLELCGASPMIISTSVMPLAVFTFIGIALWSLSYGIFKNSAAANCAAVLFFLGNSLIEPDNLAIRVAQCLVVVYLTAGITAMMKPYSNKIIEALVVATIFFVIFATRIQYGLILLVAYFFHQLVMVVRRITSLRHFVSLMTAIVISLAVCFLIFYNQPAHAAGAPNEENTIHLVLLLVGFVGLRSIIPLLTVEKQLLHQSFLLPMIIVSAAVVFFLIPLATLAGAPSLIIALLSSVVISQKFSVLPTLFTKTDLVAITFMAALAGIGSRLFYDFYKWLDTAQLNGIINFLTRLATNKTALLTISILFFVALITCTNIVLKLTRKTFNFQVVTFLIALSMSLGISIATTFRTVTAHYRYKTDLSGAIVEDSPMSWYTNPERLAALDWMRTNTNRDDIFAQNTSTPEYRTSAYSASLILGGSIHRRAYIEGTYGAGLQRDYPRHVSHQTERQRKELLRLNTSFRFPMAPSNFDLANMQAKNVKWFVVDLGNTPLRNWEPFATTRFMNEKVAILELDYPDSDSS